MTPQKFHNLVMNDIDSKLGLEPLEWTVGDDPEWVAGGALAAAPNPHHTRIWKNWIRKKQGLFGSYLSGRAQEWFFTRIAANAETAYNWNALRDAFYLAFNTDIHKGAAEIRLEEMKRNPNMTIMEWNERVTLLVEQAFSHEPAASQAEKVKLYFKKGLTPYLSQRYMETYLENRARPHHELVAIVHRIDIATQMCAGTIGKNTDDTGNILENNLHEITINAQEMQHPLQEEEEYESIAMNNVPNKNDNARRSNRFRAFCAHCKMNGHLISECRKKIYDDDTARIWKPQLDRQQKPTYNKVFNPTNPGRQPFVRPQGGNMGNAVQNVSPEQPRQMQQIPREEARKFNMPPGGDPRKNYYMGKPTPMNLNFSRGPGAPGTMNYPFRYPARWQVPPGEWNLGNEDVAPRNRDARTQQPNRPRYFTRSNDYQGQNQNQYQNRSQQNNYQTRSQNTGYNNTNQSYNMRPQQFNSMQRYSNYNNNRSNQAPAQNRNVNFKTNNNYANQRQNNYNVQANDDYDQQDDFNEYYINMNRFDGTGNSQNQKN